MPAICHDEQFPCTVDPPYKGHLGTRHVIEGCPLFGGSKGIFKI